ncbi:peptidase M13, partial [Haloferax sp. Atlit-4N]
SYLTTLLTRSEHDDPAGAAARVLAYESRLAEGHWEAAETRDVQKTTNHRSPEELRELCPAFDWITYVTGLGGTEETLRRSIVMQPDFFSHLSTVLEETPIETWREILHVRIVRSSAPYLPDPFVEANFDFYGRTLNGTPELRARWKRGVDFVEGAIGEAVGKV